MYTTRLNAKHKHPYELYIKILPSLERPPNSPKILFPAPSRLSLLLCPCPAALLSPPLPPIHFGRLNPALTPLEPCIHFGVSMVSIVFFSLFPNNLKKFSSSGSGSSAGLSLALRPAVLAVTCVRSADGTHLDGVAQGPSREDLGESVIPNVLAAVGRLPCKSLVMRSRPSRHPPVPKPNGFSTSSSSISRKP